jgi:Holliday junction resolvase RusA-like endonuclease
MNDSNHAVIDLVSDGDDASTDQDPAIHIMIPGAPVPLPRSRWFRGGSFNPARDRIEQVRAFVRRNTGTATNGPVFDRTHRLYVSIDFFLRRPMVDFRGCKRAPGNLKLGASFLSSPANGPDVDNLVKFVLDALNGVLYHDDRQVIVLVARKLRDNEGTCEGRTRLSVRNVREQDLR